MRFKQIPLVVFSVVGAIAGLMPAQEPKPTAAADQTLVLFDGSSLDAWRGYAQEKIGDGWKIADGGLQFDGSGGGDIITKQSFTDFELTFDWKVTSGANSGVMYRVTLGDSAPYLSGPEYQILDDDNHPDGKNEKTAAASLYGLYAPQDKTLQPVGQWNTAKIVQVGDHIEHWLNGKKVVEAEIGSPDWNKRVAESKFKDWAKFAASRTGHICLQDHGHEVWFRDIRIKRLKPQENTNKSSSATGSGR